MIFKVLRILWIASLFVDIAFCAMMKKCCPVNEVVERDENSDESFKCVHSYEHTRIKREHDTTNELSEEYPKKDEQYTYKDDDASNWDGLVTDDDVNYEFSSEIITLNESLPLLPSNRTHYKIHHRLPVFIGYNILVDQNSHWPACDGERKLSFKLLSEPLMKGSQSTSCIDLMNEKYHIFTCDEAEEDLTDILKLKKCCPANELYDIFARRCVENKASNVDANFEDLLHERVVIFEHEVLKCKNDEALVEFQSLVHGLKIVESSLILPRGVRDFGPEVIRNSFCIEATLNSDVEKPEGMSEEHFSNRASSKFIAKVCSNKAICKTIPCIQKCCPHGERMTHDGKKSVCEAHDSDLGVKFHSFNNSRSEIEPSPLEPTEYGILKHTPCEKYHLDDEEDGLHYLSGFDGSLFTPKFEKFYTNNHYCVDFFYYPGPDFAEQEEITMETFVCFNEEDQDQQNIQFHIYATLLAISAFFLGLTLVVYLFLPKLLNLHGKTVVCHVISLLLGYTFLSIVQFATDVRLPFCLLIAFIVYFGLLSAFSWLNVMCLDIFWTFGSIRTSHGIRRTKEMKRFMFYSLYAWGFPFVMTICTFMINFYDVMPKDFKPNIGISKCWFEKQSSPGHLIFFLLPIGIQISINFVLFVLTAIHCNRIKAEIHRMQVSDNSDQQKKKSFIADKAIFIMNVKLFSVMGISWLLEIMATLFQQKSMWWYISDVFNCLQGVLVFFVFVFKRKVLVAFQKKLGIRKVGLRPKTVGSTTVSTLTTLDTTTLTSRHNGRLTKSSSATTLNSTLIKSSSAATLNTTLIKK